MAVSDKIQDVHFERRATVYLRQSTLKQVFEHRESTARQYALRQRAIDLGWPEDQVDVIDEDLGQSGKSVERREGFQRLAEDVAQGRVGAIFALEVSRLARSCADWHQLLELCGLADVVIADEQACYTPRDYNDRLLLGLKGQMSEAELHWMRLRLQGGKLSKARRGELYVRPAPGYVWNAATKRFCLDPDEQVQRAVRLIFERFRIDGSTGGVLRYFARHDLHMPARDGASDVMRWIAPSINPVKSILKNPTYTGAYVYGRSEQRAGWFGGKLQRHRVAVAAPEAWKICVRDHHPAYIGWNEFEENQRKLAANRVNHAVLDQRGAARVGSALLQGLAVCGRCGRRMHVRYQGQHGQAQYQCWQLDPGSGQRQICLNVSATRIDAAVSKVFLDAVQPAEIELGLAVVREVERQATDVDRQWTLRLERASYEAQLAERRYKAVDPDNRVVARSLEREWNDKLSEVERLEREQQQARERDKLVLRDEDRSRILSLARDLPQVWNAETTTHAERKNLLRMLIRDVSLDLVDVPARQTRVRVLWQTGAVSDLMVERPPKSAWNAPQPGVPALIAELFAAGRSDEEIAIEIERRGLLAPRRKPWSARSVVDLRLRQGLRRDARVGPAQQLDGLLPLCGVAARLHVSTRTVRQWVERGLLTQVDGGRGKTRWFRLDEATIRRLETLRGRTTPVVGATPRSPRSKKAL
jgi:DNA invertase Pin-like site-specific DNA recombinase